MQAPLNENASIVRTHPLWRLALAYPLILALGYALKPALGEPAAMWPGHALAFGAYLLLPMRQWVWAALTTVGWELLASATLTNGLVAPHEPNFALLALANVLTAAGPAALARLLRLPRGADSLSIESLPSWLLVIALGALPGALLGASTIASATGANPSLTRIGYWVFAALLAVAALGSLVNRGLRSDWGTEAAPARSWERVGAPLLLGLLFLTAVRRPAAVIHPAVEPVLVLVPLIWMALRFSTRDVQIGVAVAAVAVAGVSAHGSGAFWAFAGSRSWREAVLSLDLFLFVSCGGTILINLLAVQQRALVHRLERDQEQLRRYARALDEAEDRARRAAAADLHDGIGQLLAGLGMTLRVLRSRTPAGEVQALVDDAADTCGHAQRSIRHVIQDLSPPEVDSASPSQMLAWLSQTFRDRYGFEVTWHVSGERLPSAHHTRLLYRCTRELLLNAWKHSGHGRAEVGLELTDHHIELTVIDEGVGFDTAQPAAGLHFGLAQLRERLHASGGALTVDSVVGEGCCATISIPLDSAAGLAVVQT